jgi:hypothetical protein
MAGTRVSRIRLWAGGWMRRRPWEVQGARRPLVALKVKAGRAKNGGACDLADFAPFFEKGGLCQKQ